jgi:hypothetical protein
LTIQFRFERARTRLKVWLIDSYCHERIPAWFVALCFRVFRLKHL